MNVKELRIGNLVRSKANGISKIEQIGSSLNPEYVGGRSLEGNYWENSYLPIPLTEEWLVRAGFAITPKTGTWWQDFKTFTKAFLKSGHHIFMEEYTAYKFDHEESEHRRVVKFEHRTFQYLNGFGINITLSYVHQLQNLHFALTGEELTFKNKEE